MNNRSIRAIMPLAAIVFSIACILLASWLFAKTRENNWKTYSNQTYGISFRYPGSWRLKSAQGSGETIPLVYADSTKCGIMSGCRAIAGVDQFNVELSAKAIGVIAADISGPLQPVQVGGNSVFLTDVQQGIEDRFQVAYVDLKDRTLILSASGSRIDPLLTIASTIRWSSVARACTDDAKLCPDGSAVGRTGPNCDFADCPGLLSNTNSTVNQNVNVSLSNTNSRVDFAVPKDWKSYTNSTIGITFRYPSNFGNFAAATSQDVGYRGTEIAYAGSTLEGSGAISITIKDGTYDPDRIEGLYGLIESKNITRINFGSRAGSMYLDGDAGCGAQKRNYSTARRENVVG